IALLPREFLLLEYMMRRSDQLLTRAMLLEEVWNYKFVPATNLVDVHMGRVRHKVDGPCDIPMLDNVRGAGCTLAGARRSFCAQCPRVFSGCPWRSCRAPVSLGPAR